MYAQADKSQKQHPSARVSMRAQRSMDNIQAVPGVSSVRSAKNGQRMVKFAGQAAEGEAVRHATPLQRGKKAQKAQLRDAAKAHGIVDQPAGKLYENEIVSFYGVAYNWLYGLYATDTDAGIAQVVEGDDGNIYIKGLTPVLYADEYYWIKAERAGGDTIVVKKQPAGIYDWGDGTYEVDYIARVHQYTYVDEDDGETYIDYEEAEDSDIKFIYKDGNLTGTSDIQGTTDYYPEYGYGIIYTTEDEAGFEIDDAYWDNSLYWNFESRVNNEVISTLPDDATAEDMVLKYKQNGENQAKLISAAFVGSDFYFKPYNYVDGWIKGSVEGNKVVVKSGQYLGIDSYYETHAWAHTATVEQLYDDYYEEYYDYGTITDELQFDYDADTKALKATEGAIFIDGARDDIYYADYYNEPEIYVFEEVAATPADPVITNFWDYDEYYESSELDFTIPTVDVDGNFIIPSKLFYSIYVDDEVFELDGDEYETFDDIYAEVPYGFTDNYWIGDTYACLFLQPANNIGLQSIYRGAGEERRSNIVFYDVNSGEIYTVATAIENAVAGESKVVSSEAYYDAVGRQVQPSAQGFVIKTVTFADGSKKSYKVVRK
ncbi:MAG: hypothetical protein IJV36_08040 [Prevotella sp.]|nr:hypothetical protein [Prevotella sp.]